MLVTHYLTFILLLYPVVATAVMPVLEHDLTLRFDSEKRSFTARDHIVIHRSNTTETAGLANFWLNPSWNVTSLSFDGQTFTRLPIDNKFVVPEHTTELEISYGGKVDQTQWPYIVWLPGDGWYPEIEDYRVRFKLTLHVPTDWNALTQGVPVDHTTKSRYVWNQQDPQQGIYLVAGPWHSYSKNTDEFRAGVMLIEPDGDLSSLYLDATLKNLERYSKALGVYPYHSFTLVENRRQTGWGMPGFTLIGSKVIRLPFIINTSFPHEILHNWWGNGVYVDRLEGNWSEGLTTYLSDYLTREQRGRGRQYRLNALIAWQDFAAQGSDFPLSQFVGRHDRATQAVGYGKGMFLFHMLRRQLGDATFLSGLREFYDKFRFQHARFSDIKHTFERVCGCPLGGFFSQWLDREGAPVVRLESARRLIEAGKHKLTIVLSQSGSPPWDLDVPVRVVDNSGEVMTRTVRLVDQSASLTFQLHAPAAQVDVDPEIELFRVLDEGEKPTTFSKVFAAKQVTVVAAEESFVEVAKAIIQQHPQWELARHVADESTDSDVFILLGWDHNTATDWFSSQHVDRYRITNEGLDIEGAPHTLSGGKVIALVDTLDIEGGAKTVLWIASKHADGVVDLISRLSHYGRYSYAVFNTPGERATATGQWPTRAGSLSRVFNTRVPDFVVEPGSPLF
ncbi:MAG: M1 family aminopeptidase [Arenicellales bacterium]|nr:M1 family aminopeptidase [Arenicellales bacterium]